MAAAGPAQAVIYHAMWEGDPASVDALLPAGYLRNPGERVHQEEKGQNRHLPLTKTQAAFSAELISHNIQVALLAAALGVTFGIGTALLLFGLTFGTERRHPLVAAAFIA